MERYLDFGLYYASRSTSRLLMRFPKQLFQRSKIDPFVPEVD